MKYWYLVCREVGLDLNRLKGLQQGWESRKTKIPHPGLELFALWAQTFARSCHWLFIEALLEVLGRNVGGKGSCKMAALLTLWGTMNMENSPFKTKFSQDQFQLRRTFGGPRNTLLTHSALHPYILQAT